MIFGGLPLLVRGIITILKTKHIKLFFVVRSELVKLRLHHRDHRRAGRYTLYGIQPIFICVILTETELKIKTGKTG